MSLVTSENVTSLPTSTVRVESGCASARPRAAILAPLLLAISIRMARARGQPAAERGGAIRPRHITSALQPGAVAEPPDCLRRIAVRASRQSHPHVGALGHVAGGQVYDAPQRRRSIQR